MHDNPVIDAELFKKYAIILSEESDKGAVLVASSVIEEALKELIQSRLLVSKSKNDLLFDGEGAPLSTFSSRIELAWRIGVINDVHRDTLTIFRRLRNEFAHDVQTNSISDPQVVDRLNAIFNVQKELVDAMNETASNSGVVSLTYRDKFNVFFAVEMMVLKRAYLCVDRLESIFINPEC